MFLLKIKQLAKNKKLLSPTAADYLKKKSNAWFKKHKLTKMKIKKLVKLLKNVTNLIAQFLKLKKLLEKTKKNFLQKKLLQLKQALEKAKAALVEHADHAAGLQSAHDELTQASYKIAETLYKQQPTGDASAAATSKLLSKTNQLTLKFNSNHKAPGLKNRGLTLKGEIMKKILVLLMIFSCIATPIRSDDSSKQRNNNSYDIKEAARKFRKKHANDSMGIDPQGVSNLAVKGKPAERIMFVEGNLITSRKAIRDSIIDLVEKNGLEYVYKNNNTSTWGWDLEKMPPLEIAIEENDKPLVNFLLQHGAKLNEPISRRSKNLTYYPIERAFTVEMIQYLKENGADLIPLFDEIDAFRIRVEEGLNEKKAELSPERVATSQAALEKAKAALAKYHDHPIELLNAKREISKALDQHYDHSYNRQR